MSYPSIVEAREAYGEIVHRMAAADVAYYELDAPIMSDAEYQDLQIQAATIEADYPSLVTADSPSQKISGKASAAFEKVKHSQRMESLANSFTPAEVVEWVEPLGGEDAIILGELKMDGLSCRLTYIDGVLTQAVTRGDGDIGEDVTHTARHAGGVPTMIPTDSQNDVGERVEVNGEIYLPKAMFDAYNERENAKGKKGKPFVNCRNGAAGALRRTDVGSMKDIGIRFMAFGVTDATYPEIDEDSEILELLSINRFEVVPHVVLTGNPTAIRVQIGAWSIKRDALDFDIDGVVWKLNSRRARAKLGSTSKAPRWATAYKFPAEQKKGRLAAINVQTGRTGALTPVAVLDPPVFVGGVSVSSVTLHNEDEINRLHLVPGCGIIVQRAGDVIPQIVSLDPDAPIVKGIYAFPATCPSCGSPAIREEGEAVRRCVNSAVCPAQLQGHLEHFVSRGAMNIDGLGGAQIKDLIRVFGFNAASQIMRLPEMVIADLDGYGDTATTLSEAMELWKGYGKGSVKKLMTGIKKARSPELAKFIYALGIRNVGEGTSKDIANHLKTVDAFFNAIMLEDGFVEAGLGKVDGIGPVVLASLDSHFSKKSNYDEAFALRRELTIKDIPQHDTSVQVFAGLTLVFTGGLERWSRDQSKLIAEELGAKVAGSVSKKTNVMIAGSNVGRVKTEAAEAAGTEVVDEQWFIDKVEGAMAMGYKLDVME